MTRITGNYLLRCGLAYALSVVSIATVQAQMACPQGVTLEVPNAFPVGLALRPLQLDLGGGARGELSRTIHRLPLRAVPLGS